MSNIRATYSGLISFSIGLLSILTGLIFSLIITRTLDSQEYGTWSLILRILVYAVVIEPVISYWITRETARSEKSQKTSIFAAGLFSSIGIIIFLLISLIIIDESFVDTKVVIFGLILVPGMFLSRVTSAINLGWKPHHVSYGLLISESSKIPLALMLVYFFDMGVLGVIISFFIAQNFAIVYQIYSIKEKIKGKIQFQYIRKWIKTSWLTLYTPLSDFIYKADILVFAAITQSVIGIAIFSVVAVVSSIITISSNFATPTYAKLLAEDKEEYLKKNLTLMLYFAVLLGSLSITFAKPALFLLNPIYEGAGIIVTIATVRVFFSMMINVFQQYIWGNEKGDKDFKIDSKRFSKVVFLRFQL